MRKNLLLLSLGVSLGLSGALMAAGAPAKVKRERPPVTHNQKRVKRKLAPGLVRSLPAAPGGNPAAPIAGVAFGKTAYVQPAVGAMGTLYMGISQGIDAPVPPAADNRVFTLSAGVGGSTGVDGEVTPMLQLPFNLNGVPQTDLSKVPAGMEVNNLTLVGNQFPVMTVTGGPADPITKIWAFVTSASPLNILTNDPDVIRDAAGNPIDHPIQAIATAVTTAAAQTPYIFAAVSQAGSDFDARAGVYRGIAVLRVGNNTLNVLDKDALSPAAVPVVNPTAAPLSLLPRVGIVAFVDPAALHPIIKAKLGANDVAMWYDNANLNRLYIGLSQVSRDDAAHEGGVLSLAMARIVQVGGKDNNLLVQPIVDNPAKVLFYAAGSANNTNGIIGFYADAGAPDRNVSTSHIRTMHTSTGYDYVIVHTNIAVGVNPPVNEVYALPVASNVDDVAAGLVGQLVKVKVDGTPDVYVGNVYTPVAPTAYANMPKATDVPAKVGADLTAAIIHGGSIADMVVSGDAVYIVLDGIDGLNAGIYQSVALFNADGFIRAWTPWRRVMGDVRQVMGMGLSTVDGTYTFLTTQNPVTNVFNTVRATAWGTTEDVTAQDQATEGIAADNLSTVLAALFPQTEGGVLSLYSFDEYTPGFKQGKFAMMVALGTSKVALIQTSKLDGADNLIPVTAFTTTGANPNVFVFDTTTPRGAALGAIAPLTCAEVSRFADGNPDGWLFVGGLGGVAVLSLNDGTGFTSNTAIGGGLAALLPDDATHNLFPGGTNWSFKQLNPSVAGDSFARTIKLAAAHGYLYVTTFNSGYDFEMVANKFAPAATAANLAEESYSTPPNTQLNDMLLVEGTAVDGTADRVLLATTNGVGYADPSGVDAPAIVGLQSNVVARFAYLGQSRFSTPPFGNLYALVQNLVNDNDSVYRFDVHASGADETLLVADVNSVEEAGGAGTAYIDFNQSRSGIFPDGSFLYSTRSADFGETEFLKLHTITDATTVTNDLTSDLDVNTAVNVLVDGLVREGASGALMLPADWGVRVNQ